MKALVIAAALVAFGVAPALAQEGGCAYSKGTLQSVQTETPTQTQTQTASTEQSTEQSTVQSETAK
ncbi:MAG: hypothetical protein QNJ30_16975 [Kiloniellales bacterium]|nr:hypothetical protein [Kiloniellales bacterium]